MLTLSEFQIAYSGLSLGQHKYSFNIEESFFSCFQEGEIETGEVKCDLLLEKKSDMLVLDFSINGFIDVVCDRCLGVYPQEISVNNSLIIKFGDEFEEMSDEIIVIPESKQEINVSQYIYEYIHLAIPAKRLHPGGTGSRMNCDKETLKKLESLNVSEKDDNNIEEIDPRWEKLKNIKFD